VRCDACGALLSIGAEQRTARGPFCDAPSVASRPAVPGRPRPTFALGFVIEHEAAARAVTDWIRQRKMTPSALEGAARRITGIYLPVYVYSATATSRYQASIGEKYRTLGLETDDDGRTSMRRREKTEYRDLTGRHVAYVSDTVGGLVPFSWAKLALVAAVVLIAVVALVALLARAGASL
jgi:hypothetical protein